MKAEKKPVVITIVPKVMSIFDHCVMVIYDVPLWEGHMRTAYFYDTSNKSTLVSKYKLSKMRK